MIKKTVTTIVLSLLPLIAQEDFLKEVKAKDLMLDRIVVPSAEDTLGISDQSKFFYNSENRSVSPNGKLIAEARTKSGYVDGIWIFNSKSGEEQQIDDRGFLPKWSPDGQKIAFLKQKVRVGEFWEGHQLYGGNELWAYDLEKKERRKITSNIFMGEFGWTPEGRQIALEYDSISTEKKGPNVLGVIDLETDEITVIDYGLPYSEINFSLSPSGKMIAYCKPLKEKLVTERWVTDAEIFIADIDGLGKKQITKTEAVETWVKWSNDGILLIVEQYGPEPSDISTPRFVKILLKKK